MEFNIGIIMPLSGPSMNIAQGIEKSFELEINKNSEKLKRNGIVIVLNKFDDQNNPILSMQGVIKAVEQDCVLVLGPSDSACAAHVLADKRFKDIPFIISFATDTKHEFKSALNAFRVTTPGWRRAEVLLDRVIEENTGSKIQIVSLMGIHTSFAQSAKLSIKQLCSDKGAEFHIFDFFLGPGGIADGISDIKDYSAPIILCSPSFEAKMFVKKVREVGFNGKIYGFGANINWLEKECIGVTLICDLNRADSHPVVADMLRSFEASYTGVSNPSIASMLAAKIVIQILEMIIVEEKSKNIKFVRKRIISKLKESNFDGILGPVSFDKDGEMIGYESISMLTVAQTQRGIEFKDATTYQSNAVGIVWNKKYFLEHLHIAGTVASIIGLVVAIVIFFL